MRNYNLHTEVLCSNVSWFVSLLVHLLVCSLVHDAHCNFWKRKCPIFTKFHTDVQHLTPRDRRTESITLITAQSHFNISSPKLAI